MTGRIIPTGSCDLDLDLRMGGWIDISNGEREWPANDGPPQRASRCSPPPPSLEGPSLPPPQLSP